eukprot:1467242-Rhodomonas_salina.1
MACRVSLCQTKKVIRMSRAVPYDRSLRITKPNAFLSIEILFVCVTLTQPPKLRCVFRASLISATR